MHALSRVSNCFSRSRDCFPLLNFRQYFVIVTLQSSSARRRSLKEACLRTQTVVRVLSYHRQNGLLKLPRRPGHLPKNTLPRSACSLAETSIENSAVGLREQWDGQPRQFWRSFGKVGGRGRRPIFAWTKCLEATSVRTGRNVQVENFPKEQEVDKGYNALIKSRDLFGKALGKLKTPGQFEAIVRLSQRKSSCLRQIRKSS